MIPAWAPLGFRREACNIGSFADQSGIRCMATLTMTVHWWHAEALTASYTGGQQVGSSISCLRLQVEVIVASSFFADNFSQLDHRCRCRQRQGTATIQLASSGNVPLTSRSDFTVASVTWFRRRFHRRSVNALNRGPASSSIVFKNLCCDLQWRALAKLPVRRVGQILAVVATFFLNGFRCYRAQVVCCAALLCWLRRLVMQVLVGCGTCV